MSPRLSRRQAERRGLRLWHVGLVLTLAFTTALLVASTVFYAGWELLGARELKPERRLDSKTLFDLVKLSFGVVAGAGALVALIVAYRRQRVDEDGALRDATRLHTERFTTAVSQLGSESAAVQLGGVHSLAGLADDAPTRELRQTGIDVLCAYLRLPHTTEADLTAGDTEAHRAYLAFREVRHTVIRVIRDRLRLPPQHRHSWQGHDFDFTGVAFDGGDFSGSTFSGANVSFFGATFAGSIIDFNKATFKDSTVDFTGATFTCDFVNFREATFSGGTVDFTKATFNGHTVSFSSATFSGSVVRFSSATFTGSTVSFHGTLFSDGEIYFDAATFTSTELYFTGAGFYGGRLAFSEATMASDTTSFVGAIFDSGVINFHTAAFPIGSRVTFALARFRGATVRFHPSAFAGAEVDFSQSDGSPPRGVVPPDGCPTPAGLRLPISWLVTP
ncbi:pentapeptide repeat-containing protein [Streptomyces sp. NPDC057456]|uniref:pentapeptide repeat-containing protein n=1 Tax=Streptomyces sp. NPDC057456 TaxID=3346139 RepID=UPI003691DC76